MPPLQTTLVLGGGENSPFTHYNNRGLAGSEVGAWDGDVLGAMTTFLLPRIRLALE